LLHIGVLLLWHEQNKKEITLNSRDLYVNVAKISDSSSIGPVSALLQLKLELLS
jgi:hypothetical protein